MSAIKLVAVVAMASNRVIGKDGDLPWYLPEDLKFFKETTRGSKVIMGRKTFESIVQRLKKPLPGRLNLVLSEHYESPFPPDQVVVHKQWETVLSDTSFSEGETVYLIGGAQLYRTFLPSCNEVLLSYVYQPYEGDATFPDFEQDFVNPEILLKTPEFEVRRYLRKTL